MVCKLRKSFYGLKQASRQWNTKLCSTLLTLGYIQSKADHSFFTKLFDGKFTAILVYVDDLVLSGNDLDEITQVKQVLDNQFSIKDLENLKFFLGMKVARGATGISLYQRKYTLDLLKEFGLMDAKPSSTPIDYSNPLSKTTGSPLPDLTPYRRLIGRLTGLHILRYLKGFLAHGILFHSHNGLKLTGYSDSDWGTCPDTRRSVSGYCFFLGSSLICWRSKEQSVVARSSVEAEYRALALATCEGVWLRFILSDFHLLPPGPFTLFCDNQSALHIAANPVFQECRKHIEIDCYTVRDKLQDGSLKLLPVLSSQQVADVLTKALPPIAFSSFHSKFGMVDFHIPNLRGDVISS
ncbi:uncharacterized protein LOC107623970 [Arachis ipaensis]|uniref:uncharacterized protein LOC107623970 n=1 Tax=Arachis ipaensis TaxID=130454 RepID=UPI000A2B8953|nr:uncharacterized protein LOC107623970 [Arachis ipaensis]